MRLNVYKSVISYEIIMKLGKLVSIADLFVYIKFKQFAIKIDRDMWKIVHRPCTSSAIMIYYGQYLYVCKI